MFVSKIHHIWPLLSKSFIDDVTRYPDRYPLMSVPNRFIVPGSLFQVYFYWDSYWIIRGLLLSDLFDTARGIIQNFAHVLQILGHIPNSGNVQFSQRSQPPLFTQMLYDYFLATKDREFVAKMLPFAETELEWWRMERSIRMSPLRRSSRFEEPNLTNNREQMLYRYRTRTNCPRPEGFLLDFQFGIESGRTDLEFFWSSTISASESGMDFSSRWFSTGDPDEEMAYTRKGIVTNNVLPVDLNVYMALNYRAMAEMHTEMGNQKNASANRERANALTIAIEDVFRSMSFGVWFDYDLSMHRLRKRFYPTNIFPLLLLSPAQTFKQQGEEGDNKSNASNTLSWTSSFDANRETICATVLAYLQQSGALAFKGGLPSSMERNSVELWDFPIGRPSLNHFAVLGLLRCQTPETTKVAKKIADGFLLTAFNGLFNPRRGMPAQIWEKYDVRFDDGRPGFGADNAEQTGFGWTNGVLLDFIRLFHTDDFNQISSYWRPV